MDLTRERKDLWKMEMMALPFVVGGIGTIPKKQERDYINGR